MCSQWWPLYFVILSPYTKSLDFWHVISLSVYAVLGINGWTYFMLGEYSTIWPISVPFIFFDVSTNMIYEASIFWKEKCVFLYIVTLETTLKLSLLQVLFLFNCRTFILPILPRSNNFIIPFPHPACLIWWLNFRSLIKPLGPNVTHLMLSWVIIQTPYRSKDGINVLHFCYIVSSDWSSTC